MFVGSEGIPIGNVSEQLCGLRAQQRKHEEYMEKLVNRHAHWHHEHMEQLFRTQQVGIADVVRQSVHQQFWLMHGANANVDGLPVNGPAAPSEKGVRFASNSEEKK